MLSVSTQIAREDDLATFKRMLSSVSFASDIVIYNMERDDLAPLASKKIRIVNIKTPKIVEEIRSAQVRDAKHDWVLVMDYDEVVPSELEGEIQAIIEGTGSSGAYAIPRDNYSLGYPLRYGGWERDYVVRLINRESFVDWPKNIHSTPIVKGGIAKTHHYLEHHKDASLSQMVAKTNRYSEVEAKLFYDGHLPQVTVLTLIRKPVMEFVRRYFLKKGLLDGRVGLIQSLYQSYSIFITYAKLYELQNGKK